MNRQGPGGQPVRGMPGFPGQQVQPARASSRGAGSQAGWGYSIQNGSGQSMSASQARSAGHSTFAQSIGAGQSQSPLDLSDFPSLGGPSQSQQNAVWSQRTGQPGGIQRSQHGAPGGGVEQGVEEAFFSAGGDTSSGLDDYHHGGQGGLGQLSSSGQPQPGPVDEFPPLGRRGQGGSGSGDIGPDRRMNLMQNAAASGFSGAVPFSAQPGSRGPSGSLRQGLDGGAGGVTAGMQNGAGESSPFNDIGASQATARAVGGGQPENGAAGSRTDPAAGSGGAAGAQDGGVETGTVEPSDRDRYGLRGLLENIRSGDPNNLAIGIDLTNLGLDLNAAEPLYPTFGGPFAHGPARPLQPEFVLPGCYSVGNVHPLEEKIASVTDETLFWMFYNIPRDVAQELAAAELTNRTWRYHKPMRTWITKEAGFGEPQAINSEMERGRYVLFNSNAWRRETRDMILRYADLDDHITPTLGPSGMA